MTRDEVEAKVRSAKTAQEESAARREYEHDAHKRLYAECEPLLFQLAELSAHAYYGVYSLARTARRGDLPNWLSSDSYYLRSTMYKLIAPMVIFRIIQQRLTFVDLSLDLRIAKQYGLLKFLYFTFTDSFDFAKLAPEIEYDPDKDGWEELRKSDQRKYWRQGMYLGALDNSIDAAKLEQNQPNPFNQSTTIRYTLPAKFISAQIVITDQAGKVLKQVNILSTSNGVLNIQAGSLAAGTYNYSLVVDSRMVDTKKMILVK
jgi:hypothetical protein